MAAPVALANPDHERYPTWIGGQFSTQRFDLNAVDLAFSKIKAK
jgi:hypothetical protein